MLSLLQVIVNSTYYFNMVIADVAYCSMSHMFNIYSQQDKVDQIFSLCFVFLKSGLNLTLHTRNTNVHDMKVHETKVYEMNELPNLVTSIAKIKELI